MIDTVSQPLARRFTKPGEATEVVALRAARVRRGATGPRLGPAEVEARLAEFPDWVLHPAGPGLVRLYRFPSVRDAAAFAFFAGGLLADLEVAPDFEILGSTVSVRVSTLRGTGEVSEQDFDLASLLDGRGESGR